LNGKSCKDNYKDPHRKWRAILLGAGGIVVALAFVAVVVFYMALSQLLEITEDEVLVIDVPNREYRIRVSYFPGNAVTMDFLQFRKVEESSESLIAIYEGYELVERIGFEGDSVLSFVLSYTAARVQVQDTFSLRLDEISEID